MKKIIHLMIIVCLSFLLTACEMNIKESEDESGSNQTIIKDVVLNYDASRISTELDAISRENGILIELDINVGYGENAIMKSIVYAQKSNLFYFLIDDEEVYFDLSNEDKAIIYNKEIDDDDWEVDELIYSEDEKAYEKIKNDCRKYYNIILNYLGQYSIYQGEKMEKSSDIILGRECDTYSNYVYGYMSSIIKYTFSIDKETNACLKWDVSIEDEKGIETGTILQTVKASFECVRFETNYELTVPEINNN